MLRARLPLKAGASTLAAAASVIGPQHRVGRLARAVARPGAVAAAAVTGATRGYHVETRRQQVRWGRVCRLGLLGVLLLSLVAPYCSLGYCYLLLLLLLAPLPPSCLCTPPS